MGFESTSLLTLDANNTTTASNYFAHAWNYEYANRYGSPEFSAREPDSLGHDPIEIRSVALLHSRPNMDSVFVEMPHFEPVMQLHLRMHLKNTAGTEFKTDLFASPMYPGEHFDLPGLASPVEGKLTAISLRSASQSSPVEKESGTPVEGEREMIIETIGGLQYKQKRLEAKPNEALALKLKNTDVMPHNLVFVRPGATRKVGMASFSMLNDPEAGKKHYVPDLEEVIVSYPSWLPVQNTSFTSAPLRSQVNTPTFVHSLDIGRPCRAFS